MSTSARDDLGHLTIRTAEQIGATPWEPLPGADGVSHKVLWQSGDNVIGLIKVEAGVDKPEHTHHGAHHHIWITAGRCTMVGAELEAGSYIYIPPGTAHAVTGVGPDGCEFLYTYRSVEVPTESNPLAGGMGSPV